MNMMMMPHRKTLRKMPKFHLISWCGIFCKYAVSAEFQANCQKFCRNCAFPQNFYTKKQGEVTVFYAGKALSYDHVLSSTEYRNLNFLDTGGKFERT